MESIITEEDRQVLGENCEPIVVGSLLYLGRFLPEPTTFCLATFTQVAADQSQRSLSQEQTRQLANIGKREGLMIEREGKPGEFVVKPDIQEKLQSILSQSQGN